jgi:hypothetical protein
MDIESGIVRNVSYYVLFYVLFIIFVIVFILLYYSFDVNPIIFKCYNNTDYTYCE